MSSATKSTTAGNTKNSLSYKVAQECPNCDLIYSLSVKSRTSHTADTCSPIAFFFSDPISLKVFKMSSTFTPPNGNTSNGYRRIVHLPFTPGVRSAQIVERSSSTPFTVSSVQNVTLQTVVDQDMIKKKRIASRQ